MKSLSVFLSLLLALPGISHAQLKDENLLQNLPKGYKVDFETKQGNMVMTEMVPNAETVGNWTEMVTTQIFLGMKDTTPAQFQAQMIQNWSTACQGAETAPMRQGDENGYAFSLWIQVCPLNSSTGKPEYTFFKAIKGNDSLYVVQKAFRFDPSKEQIGEWMEYFASIMVCDSRLADRQCPDVKRVR